MVSSADLGVGLYEIISLWKKGGTFEPPVYYRYYIEIILFLVICGFTLSIVKFLVDTSHLLNGWYLAAYGVWGEEGDGRPSVVHIDVVEQKALPKAG
jgi:hypothetical protein